MFRNTLIVALTFVAILAGSTVALIAQAPEAETPSSPPAIKPAPVATGEAPDSVEGSCLDGGCHAEVTHRTVIHGPLANGECGDCHEQQGRQHIFEPMGDVGKKCRSCHADQRVTEDTAHLPFQNGLCTSCHDPHGSDNRRLLAAKTDKAICTGCHEDYTQTNQFVHGPVAAGACTICHNPHQSENKKLIRTQQPDLCIDCHSEFTDRNKAEFGQAPTVHKPLNDGCAGCHDPHASNVKFQLKKERDALCFDCHGAIRKQARTSKEKHGAMAILSRCQNCHQPHFSVHPKLLIEEEATTCYACHGTVKSGNKELADIGKLVTESETTHGPLRQKVCSPCHNPHGSDNFRILTAFYPETFYEPFAVDNYALCFTCHPKTLVLDPKTEALTDFRNGDNNLHYLHVNRKKGRTCRSCHETHASNNPKHIRDAVPFGSSGWMLPINYKKATDGGACAPGCHRQFGYDRNNPVDNSNVGMSKKEQ